MESQLSKSEKKRRAKGTEQLVCELASLPLGEIASLPCAKEVREEIAAAKKLKGGARKRQLKYATKLLRHKPVEELYDYLSLKKGSQLKEKREFQELEHLRNLLVDEAVRLYEERMHDNGYINENEAVELLQDSATIRVIEKHLPVVDRMQLEHTAMQYARTRNRKFSRELFRLMKGAQEKARFTPAKDKDDGL